MVQRFHLKLAIKRIVITLEVKDEMITRIDRNNRKKKSVE
jgi:hypothetical protein